MGFSSSFGEILDYPAVRRDETVVENYHGVLVPDPYRWLEDHDSAETQEFVDKQNELTESVLKNCEYREKFSESLTNSFDFPKYDPPFRAGNKMFYFHNTGLQPYDVLYIQDGLDGKPEILIDGNTLSDDGTVTLCDALCVPSEDGKYLAYGITLNGSDFITIKVMRIEDKTTEPDTVSWAKFPSVCWTKDNKGFFYSRYEAPADEGKLDAEIQISANQNHDIYYHFLGTDQSEDVLCWRDPSNPTEPRAAKVTEDGKYVLMFLRENCNESKKVYYCDLSSLPNGLAGYKGTTKLLPFVKLIDNFDASYDYVANDDTVFTFLTSKDAPRNKLVRVDLNEPSSWTDVIPEHEKDVIESVVAVNGNQIVVNYMSDVKSVLQLRDLSSGDLLHHLPLDIGAVSEISARREDSIIFIEFISFLVPGIIYICNLEGEVPDMRIFRETVVPGLDRNQFESTQVFVPTKDGSAKIPLFITAKKGIRLDGSHPCVMHGYGGFAISIAPFFSVSRLLVVKHFDGVFCVANIRGGSEYGEEWHRAAYLGNKQKSFDDFISAAEYLVSAGYTQPSKLCIEGASNGGLLVGACINQRPDLFGCAIPDCSVMDMLRFHKFTIGHGWTSDYGCSDKEEDFHWLIKYSPLHNVRRPWDTPSNKHVQYPATMIMTAEHDDRVVSLHTYKLLATMQYELCTSVENTPQKNPIIGRIEREAGHGSGMSTQLRIAEAVDQFAFMAKATGATWVD